ncbi:MAG: hypothetical protein JXB03_13395 [Spirochaetales bacterium]|nr:hypothetical protein [Spirochaetales bacterium]
MKKIIFFTVLVILVSSLMSCNIFGGASSDGDDRPGIKIPQLDNPPDYVGSYSMWGLGEVLVSQHHNDVDYYWYFDQKNTGVYSEINCGPAAVTMAVKWADETFDKNPVDARKRYRSSGGWWHTYDIIRYLEDYDVINNVIVLNDMGNLTTVLNTGGIVILCLDMYYITLSTQSELHIDSFSNNKKKGDGHFIVIKGYMEVDGTLWFEIYDPASWGRTYSNGTLKGINRYYRSEEIDLATDNWWDYAIVVTGNSSKGRSFDPALMYVDPAAIDNMPGK